MMQVLQRKSEEAAAATRRLKEVLEARKSTKEHASNGVSSLSLFVVVWLRLQGKNGSSPETLTLWFLPLYVQLDLAFSEVICFF
jgi:kinesin family protein 4/21/27